MTRASCLIATCALALAGCGNVIFDDDGAVETSSAQGATTGATGDGSGGGSTSTASGEGGAAPVGQGGAPPAPGAGGGGGEGGARPLEVCADLAWAEPIVTDVTNATAHSVHLRSIPGSMNVRALYAGRSSDDVPTTWRLRYRKVQAPWSGDVDFDGGSVQGYPGADDELAVGLGPEHRFTHVHATEDTPVRLVEEDARIASLPVDLAPVRSLAWSDAGRYVLVSGTDELRVALVTPSADAPAVIDTDLAACGDRSLASAVAPFGDGFAVALATGSPGGDCDPAAPSAPTSVELAHVDTMGAITRQEPLALPAPVDELHLQVDGETVWVVARMADRALIVHQRGEARTRVEVPVGLDRQVTVARRGRELALVDLGPPVDASSWARVRIVDPDGVVRADSSAPPQSYQSEAIPGAIGSPDGRSLLIGFWNRAGNGMLQSGLVRADCVAREP